MPEVFSLASGETRPLNSVAPNEKKKPLAPGYQTFTPSLPVRRGLEKNTILIDFGRLNLKSDNLKNYLYSFTFSHELSAKHYVCLPPSPRDN